MHRTNAQTKICFLISFLVCFTDVNEVDVCKIVQGIKVKPSPRGDYRRILARHGTPQPRRGLVARFADAKQSKYKRANDSNAVTRTPKLF